MMALGMVPIFVSDQQRALEFYTEKLGFVVVMDNPYTGYGPEGFRWITVAPEVGGPQLILYHPGMNPDDASLLEPRVGAWTGIVFFADNIQDTYKELVERGVKFDAPPSQQPWGGWETWFVDPDGNRFHLGTRP